MASLNPYLNFNGNTEEVFNFYKDVFGGEFMALMRFEDNLEACDSIPESDRKGIMHVALAVGPGSVLMGSDVPSSMPKVSPGNNFTISIDLPNQAEADRIFAALSDGGSIQMPMAKMFWGAYFGMLTDKFAIQWMVNYDPNKS